MSYIFRPHTEGINILTDWGNSAKYGSNVIEQIQDPNGDSAKREITSIPSPFARIDLLKTAFKKVTDSEIDGKTIYHKMVSDCLDVGQIFFEFDKHRERDLFEIMVWDKKTDLQALLDSPHYEHQQLGKTYEIFLKQDGAAYNFDRMQQMFFLNFKRGPGEINIVGATSPATLFFTSANDLSFVSETIYFGGKDSPFDDDFKPLYKRDIEYIKYWYLLRKTVPNFAILFREVDTYLEQNFRLLTSQQKIVVQDLNATDLDKYLDIPVGSSGNPVQIIDGLLLKQQRGTDPVKSGFIIKSDATVDGLKPLVLPVFINNAPSYNLPTVYTSDFWDKNTKVPYYDEREIKDRTLPKDGAKYPYLTISDFLEDTIVRMPFEINKTAFFDGNINRPEGNSYLLPLTNTFFKFFTVEDLRTQVMIKDNKKMFELKTFSTGVRAILRIPIKDGYVEYQRNYFEAIEPDPENNDGALIEKKIGLGILPLMKFPDNVKSHYRIALFDKGRGDVELKCYSGENPIKTKAHTVRDKKNLEMNIASVESYVINDNFDRIVVDTGEYKGVIVPKFATVSGRTEFIFAVDFGTTNTHIEYSINDNNNPKPFDIRRNEKQMHRLHVSYPDKDIALQFEHNFIPETIADDDEYSFPMRTAFSEYVHIDYKNIPKALADGNIPFFYEKKWNPEFNETKTDLKWGGVPEEIVSLYIENIFILLRNKVLLNGGNPEKTKVIWFYPASMNTGRCDDFEAIWRKKYTEYFGDNAAENLVRISESAAPYRYYSKKKGAKSEVVTIDVGGGTTDVFVVENSEEKLLLSFRFASNAILGDGYNWDSDNNGFVQLYFNRFLKILNNSPVFEIKELGDVLQKTEAKKKSPDIIAFLFSLAQNKRVDGNTALDFLNELSKNKKLKYVFIIFYGSILYFIAKVMKTKELKRPLTLAFSGNGSKSLRILANKNEALGEFAQLIFDGVYNSREKLPLDIIFEENPKVATCKGGILIPNKQDPADIKNIKTVLIGDNLNVYPIKSTTYEEITEDVQANIVQSVIDFVEFLFRLHKENDEFFIEYLGADEGVLPKVKEICLDKTELNQSLRQGLAQKAKEIRSKDKAVEETLFFYPLIGVLHKLAREIGKE